MMPAMAPLPRWFAPLCWLFAGLLGLSAALQYNDPDPVLWIALYGAGCLVSIALPRAKPLSAVGLLLGLVCAAWAIYLVHSVWGRIALSDLTNKMSEKGGAVEVGREAGGLLLEAVWLLFASSFRAGRA